MSPGILGKKIGMTQVFRPDGQVVPVTLLKAGPCMVVQRKTPATDGYDAVQLGLIEFVKAAADQQADGRPLEEGRRRGREVPARVSAGSGVDDDLKAGDQVLVDEFKPNDKVDVIGVSKGRGFAGVVKRHHFRGGDGIARFDVPPRARFDRRIQLSFARVSGHAHGRPHGQRAGDGAQSRNRRSGHRGQRAGGEGRGARSERRLRAGAEVEEVTPCRQST